MSRLSHQPDDPGVGPFHVDFAAHDAALMARTWRIATVAAICAAVLVASLLAPYFTREWPRIASAVCATEERI